MPFFWVLPFILLLLSIALLPLAAARFWESNRNKAAISLGLALPVIIYCLLARHELLTHALREYVSFMAIAAGLFIVAGGLLLEGDIEATPRHNTAFLGIGVVLASLIGTTGASMLLIRPFLSTNSERKQVVHLPVFFIILVSNIGGLLTPIGDPPLFLGYLRGVPFFWTLKLFPLWFFCVGLLLAFFFAVDSWMYRREALSDKLRDWVEVKPLKLSGKRNLALLAGVVGSVFLPFPFREIGMASCALLSVKFTPAEIRRKNAFHFHPIIEVGVLFLGIFITMAPALELLALKGPELGLGHPAQFFWYTGILSSFLDNAPTYLAFLSLAQGLGLPEAQVVGVPGGVLMAISAGAVCMGALTYIGNGPNFMVKAIADSRGMPAPSFLGYMFWSGIILIPLFIAVTLIFFRS